MEIGKSEVVTLEICSEKLNPVPLNARFAVSAL
jgi:hypothetical protein